MLIDKVSYTDKSYENHQKFWNEFIEEFDTFSFFKNDQISNTKSDENLIEYNFNLKESTLEVLKKLSNNDDSAIFVIMASSISLLLKRYTNNSKVIIDTPCLINSDFQINKVPLLFKIEENITLLEFLNTNQEQIRKSYEYQDYPLQLLNGDSNNFATNVIISYSKIHKHFNNESCYDLIFNISNIENQIFLNLKYNPVLISGKIIKNVLNQIENIIKQYVNVKTYLSDVNVLTNKDLEKISNFNDTKIPLAETSILELFELQVEKKPKNVCIQYEGEKYSYKAIDEKANQLASTLKIKQNEAVGILMDYSPNCIIGILGIMKSGGVYLPIDPELPIDRIKFILNDSNIKVILSENFVLSKNDQLKDLKNSHRILFLDQEETFDKIYSKPICNRKSDFPVYILYTSGSTGEPKGVVIKNKAILNNILWSAKTYVGDKKLSFGLYTSLTFDITATSIFTALITGNKLIVYKKVKNEFLIETVIKKNEIEVIKLTPSHLKLIKHLKLDNSNIKTIIVGGENFETQLAKEISTNFGNHINIYNIYGPTEAAIMVLYHKFEAENDSGFSVPLGKPIDNVKIYILDENLHHVPIGSEGSLYISGVCIGDGYINRPELTKELFVVDPFSEGKMYRSGDIVKRTSDNVLEFVGREDDQVKIRGFRIELDEIKSKLLKHDEISDCIISADKNSNVSDGLKNETDKKIIAYIVTEKDFNLKELRSFLLNKLPVHMIPSDFIKIKEIPLNKNGKIDRKRLRILYEIENKNQYEAPISVTQAKIIEIWKDLLNKTNIGISDDFFEIGGHSIMAAQIVHKIYNTFNVNILIRDIFNYSTVEELSKLIENDKKENDLIFKLGKIDKIKPNLFFIPTIIGTSIVFKNLAKLIENEYNCFGLQQKGSDSGEIFDKSIEEIAESFILEIEKVQTSKECVLVGYSYGVYVAYEMARILENKGYNLSLIFLEKNVDEIFSKDFIIDDEFIDSQVEKEIGSWHNELNNEQMTRIKEVLIHNLKLTNKFEISNKLKSNIVAIESEDKTNKVMLNQWSNLTLGKVEYTMVSGNHFEVLQPKNLPIISELIKLQKNN